ncbi:hypothetical protein LCGC14_1305280 [marine sediment metagenome]|uniref:Portal protein n=1 Tax=marine sediment metagenome TaxID=412755 RepID=A0A0F9L8S3_9ZZZZ
MDTLTLIKNRMQELNPLHLRMDKTRERVYNTPYVMPSLSDPSKPMDNVINVTMPYAAIIANTVINDLMTSFRQTIVDGDISATSRVYIEGFVNNNRDEADELLVNSSWHASLKEIWCSHVCIRSFIGVRWVSQIIDGKYVIDILPMDMRYVSYEYGNDGQNWVNNRTFRPKWLLEQRYAKQLEKKGASLHGDSNVDIQVDDWWSSERKELYIGGDLLIDQKNPFGEPPFVIAAPATGFMLRDKEYIEHDSEDILYLVRGVLDELNRTASIEQTKGAETIRPPYIQETPQEDSKPAKGVPTTGQVKKYKAGEQPQLLQTPDINNAFLTGRADLSKIVQMGGVNDIDLGNVSQTVSAVWITAQAGIRKKFSGPRLKAIAQGDQQLARLMIRQAKKAVELESGSPDIIVGGMGRKKTYSADKLGDPDKYGVRIELRSQSKTEEIANLAQYEAAQDLPTRWRLEHILGVDDPDAIIREMDFEEAKRMDPAIGLSEDGISLAREAEDIEDEEEADLMKLQSMMLIERAVALLKERLNPSPVALPGQETKPKQLTQGKPLVQLPKLLEGVSEANTPQQPREVAAQ